MQALTASLAGTLRQAEDAVVSYRSALTDISTRFTDLTEGQRTEANLRLREMRAQGIDGAAYLQLERSLAEAEPLEAHRTRWAAEQDELRRRRREMVVAQEDRSAVDVRRLDGVSRQLSGRLAGLLRVRVERRLDDASMSALVREHVGGRLDQVIRALASVTSGRALADAGRAGSEALLALLGDVPRAQVERLAAAEEGLWLRLEELIPQPAPVIELNTGDPAAPVWQQLEFLSAGQKATALLLLLLSQSTAPLLIDQPEDDLDNAFVSTVIVPRIRAQKDARQFLLSSHNANIPVLADADLIAALDVRRVDDRLQATLPASRSGSLDTTELQVLVEELLEGGRAAFEARRYRYGF